MAYLNISSYKMDIIQELIKSPTIISAIDSKSTKYDPDSPDTLIYENIFPHIKISKTQMSAQTYILMAVRNTNIVRNNKYFTNIETIIRVMSHESCMRMPKINGTRIDYIGDEIKKIFAGKINFGFGEMELLQDDEDVLSENTEYQYRQMIFHNIDARQSALRSDFL